MRGRQRELKAVDSSCLICDASRMLTEDQVVDALRRNLSADGYSIEQRALATQHGFDIVARRDGLDLVI